MYKLWDALEGAKKLKWVELSHSMNNSSPYWAGIPEGSVELSKTVFDRRFSKTFPRSSGSKTESGRCAS